MLRASSRAAIGLAFLAVIALAAPARAQSVSRAAGVEVWQLGAPARALAQSEDGYLWIGTDAGLARFDGVRFETVPLADGVRRLAVAPGGVLWLGSSTGALSRRDRRGLAALERDAGAPVGSVEAIAIAPDGAPWVAFHGGLARIGRDGRLHAAATPAGIGPPSSLARAGDALLVGHEGGLTAMGGRAVPDLAGAAVDALLVDEGRLWIAQPGPRIALVADGQVRTFDLTSTLGGRIVALASDGASGVFAGGERGVVHIANGLATALTDREGLPENAVTAMMHDREGNLWVATENGYLVRFAGRRATTFTYTEGLLGRVSFAVAETRDGNVWASTTDGMHRFGLHEIDTFHRGSDVPSWCIRALAGAEDGGLWIGSCDVGLVYFKPGGASHAWGPKNGALPTDDVRALLVARDGTLWLGSAEGHLFTFRDGRFTPQLADPTCAPVWKADSKTCPHEVAMLLERRDGSIWIAQHGDGFARVSPGPLRRYGKADGLASDRVTSLYEDPAGQLWVGSEGGGLARLGGDGRVVNVPPIGPNVFGIVEDGMGDLWLSTDKGIVVVARADLERWIAAPTRGIAKRLLGRADGMLSEMNYFGFQSPALRSRDGRIWFPNDAGVVIFGPPEGEKHPSRSAVLLEELRYDGRAADLEAARAGTLALPPGRGDFELRYTVPRFEAPHLVRFQYRLVGYDRGWVDAQDRRTAFYTNIQPGHYTFEVRAVDEGRGSAPTEARIAWRVLPHFYQTWAFYLLCAVAVGLFGFGVHRVRVLQVRRTYRALLAERTRIARDLHDSLAQGFTGVGYQLNRLSERLHGAPGETRAMLDQAAEMVRYCQVEARQTIWNLRSSTVDARSFDSALRELANQAKKAAMGELVVEVAAAPLVLPLSVEEQLLRIAQEATTNAIAHGRATHIQLGFELDEAGAARLTIRDDGRGFDADATARAGHFGLVGMRERAARLGGELRVTSAPGAGTMVELRVPGERLQREVAA